jgi:starch phosphorylase
VAFIEDYDLEVAGELVQGADIWLNNPRRFLEASGTSGMKAAANGVLNLSILDGWWDEGYRPDVGWFIPSDATFEHPEANDWVEAERLYDVLESEVVPRFYERDRDGRPERWLRMMRASIRHAATNFSARRMVSDYFYVAYGPAGRRARQLHLPAPAD